MASLQTAFALLSGEAGPPWAARAARVRSMLATVIGRAPPEIEVLPPDRDQPFAYPTMLPTNPARPAIEEAAEDLVDAIARRRFSRLDGLLQDDVWAMWPTGHIGRHPKAELLAALAQRDGKPAPLRVDSRASYTFAELKSALAKGLPDLLDVAFGARSGLTVTLGVNGPRGPGGRMMVVMAPSSHGDWRARTLPFGGWDDAHLASVRPSSLSDDIVKAPHKITRCVVLGHGAQLRSLTNLMADPMFVRENLGPKARLADIVGEGPHRIGSAEIVFMGSEEVSMKRLREHGPKGIKEKLEGAAPDAWGRALNRLDPRLVVTQLGQLDAATMAVTPVQTSSAVVIEVWDDKRDERVRRVAALFI